MVWGCGCQGFGEVAAGRNLGEEVMMLMGGPTTLGNRGQPLGSRTSAVARKGLIFSPGLFKAGSGFVFGTSARES